MPNATPSSCPFQFLEQGSHAAIIHAGQEILSLDKNVTYFGLGFFVRDQVLEPGGRAEVAFVPTLSFYPDYSVRDVRYEVVGLADSLSVRIIPSLTKGGGGTWIEEDILSVRMENGRFVWTQEAVLSFPEDTDLEDESVGARIYRFHHADGRPARMFQYFDPAPAGSSGPAVPMDRDWLEYHEPYTGPDGFRKHWKRDYVSIIFQDPDGGYSAAGLNKTLWANMTLDNRRARPCGDLFYLVKDSGHALECLIEAPSHYHHVCEWGMDFHAFCDLDPFACGSVIPAGTIISCSTTMRLVEPDVVAPLLAGARRMELTPAESAVADRPAYEEPENFFNVSALDRFDAQTWQATSEGCSWIREGGHTPGSGCLVVRNDYSACGSWRQEEFGSQNWGNPIIFGACYRLSAWVRIETFLPDPSQTDGPQVGVELIQENGPAVGATRTVIDCGWSPSLINDRLPLPTSIGWTHIELVTPPAPNFVQRGVLKLRLHGRGTAYFSNVRWETVGPE